MKKIFTCLALSLFCINAFSQTTLPVQLISPAGSTSGQVIVSNGSASSVAWGNPGTSPNLTGVITSVGNVTSTGAQTGTGNTFVMSVSPVLTSPALGTPSSGVATNLTGTAASLNIGGNAATATTAGTVTTAAQPAITSVGTLTTLNVTGASTVGSTLTASALTANQSISASSSQGAFHYGTLSYAGTNVFSSYQTSVNAHAQSIWQNTSNGPTASTHLIVSNDQGNGSNYYATFGMNSSGFTGSGSLNIPGSAYLTGTTGDLSIGTTTSNAIHFLTNSSATDAATVTTGNVFTLVSSALGTPNSGVITNFSGTCASCNIGGSAGTATTATTAGTVTTAAQPAITSVGTLSGLTVTAPISGSVTGSSGSTTGNAATATTATNQSGGTVSATTLTASSTVTLSPANANVSLSPTGTGTTTINPATASAINNETLGLTTPLAAKVTTITATGLISPTYPSGVAANATGSIVNAGSVGYVLTNTNTATSLTSTVLASLTSVSLTAGDWDVDGSIYWTPGATTTVTSLMAGLAPSSTALPGSIFQTDLPYSLAAGAGLVSVPLPHRVVNVSTTTTYYCNTIATFAVSTMTAVCYITARLR